MCTCSTSCILLLLLLDVKKNWRKKERYKDAPNNHWQLHSITGSPLTTHIHTLAMHILYVSMWEQKTMTWLESQVKKLKLVIQTSNRKILGRGGGVFYIYADYMKECRKIYRNIFRKRTPMKETETRLIRSVVCFLNCRLLTNDSSTFESLRERE